MRGLDVDAASCVRHLSERWVSQARCLKSGGSTVELNYVSARFKNQSLGLDIIGFAAQPDADVCRQVRPMAQQPRIDRFAIP